MPRLPLNRCFGFQSGMWWSASPFLPNFSCCRIFFLRIFSTFCCASSSAMPAVSRLLLRALEPRSTEPATEPSPAVASRFLLPSSVSGFLRSAERPRTLVPSRPTLLRAFSTSSPFFRPLRMVGRPFLFLLRLFTSLFCRILLWTSSKTCCVFRKLVITWSSSRSDDSCISRASSFSSSASFASMSGSTKSATLWPSMNSGTTSYFQVVSSRMAFRHKSVE
mmetsp:Transcript_985/g.2999  ORF Transcript_985/g.2999 Transcript_985/m.2999 type:complete len:221 (-) Transcript_985:1327-1989(-)